MSHEARVKALADLRAAVARGEIQSKSKDYYRLREAAKSLDPAFRARKAAYARARKAAKAGDESLMQSYRDGQAVAYQARRPKPRDERPPRPKFRCKQTDPGILKLQAADRARIDAVAREIAAAECPHYEQQGAWRVRCLRTGQHDVCAFRRTA